MQYLISAEDLMFLLRVAADHAHPLKIRDVIAAVAPQPDAHVRGADISGEDAEPVPPAKPE